jgi:hypothetical protein
VNYDPTGAAVGKDVKIELDLDANQVDAAAPGK